MIDICNQEMKVGSCYDWESRYFYNKTSAQCEHFFYGGCEGNGNNFATEDECSYHCLKQAPTTPSQISEVERTQPTQEPVRTVVPDTGHGQQISGKEIFVTIGFILSLLILNLSKKYPINTPSFIPDYISYHVWITETELYNNYSFYTMAPFL